MSNIKVLDQSTINKIAAGEVIERPASVVKELVENAIDAKATSITVEIKEGGTSLIRITDNGCGISKEDVPTAFMRHATSKIRSVEDLMTVTSLGFRGEALSSIAAVAQVELITKTDQSLTGTRYEIHGGKEIVLEDIGCPEGTTFLVRNLFFNTPARRKFLKSAMTEANYIESMIQRLALSNPDISIRYINNGNNKLFTAGNGNLKDMIYHIYGRDIAAEILPIDIQTERINLNGYIGKPVLMRSNRTYETFFVNGRYVKSTLISKAVEEAYKPYLMTHKYPFIVLNIFIHSELLDVNVHPTKMELRFKNGDELYALIVESIRSLLSHRELIPEVSVNEKAKTSEIPFMKTKRAPEPFEAIRGNQYVLDFQKRQNKVEEHPVYKPISKQETTLFDHQLLSKDFKPKHRMIGQLFQTYWLLEFEDNFYIMDQHAAHEKVLFERLLRERSNKSLTSQQIMPPMIITLNGSELQVLEEHRNIFHELGFQFEEYGGNEICVRGVPAELYGLKEKELFLELIDELSETSLSGTTESMLNKLASMACKAAVKGNMKLSYPEASELMDELMTLDNPYHCPHGRPTLISMSKTDIERKFKRIQS